MKPSERAGKRNIQQQQKTTTAAAAAEAKEVTMDCNVQGSPEAKKPCKGILKTSSSFDKHSVSQRRKSTKFDEINVMQTYHPPDKDYGHMKVEEPKTPFNYANPEDQIDDQVDADVLAERLQMSEPRKSLDDTGDDESSEDERSYETPEEKQRRLDFEKRRKLHYNEFEALKMARKLMEEDEEDDDEDGGAAAAKVRALANQSEADDQSHEVSATADNDDERESTTNEIDMDNDAS